VAFQRPDFVEDTGVIPSKKFDAWTRLYRRFLLEPRPANGVGVGVGKGIVPVTDADRLLQATQGEVLDTVAVTTNTRYTIATVPDGERWTVMYLRVRKSDGTWTFNNFQIILTDGFAMEIHEFTASSSSELWQVNPWLEMDEGQSLAVNVNTHSVNGNMNSDILRLKEDAF